jgi:hypothetical protein
MSVTTATYTSTYTVVDVRRVLDQFGADYDMAAQSTGLAADDHVTKVIHDVKAFAEHGYLNRVDIVLCDASGNTIRAHRYIVSTDASLWTTQRPGDSLWPRTPAGSLRVVIFRSDVWRQLPPGAQAAFGQDVLELGWSGTDIDTSYSGLTGHTDRRYGSNGFGLERTAFTK